MGVWKVEKITRLKPDGRAEALAEKLMDYSGKAGYTNVELLEALALLRLFYSSIGMTVDVSGVSGIDSAIDAVFGGKN
jgi:dihydroorotate dehydrogenase